MISGITPDGRSAFQTHETSINGLFSTRFLRHLPKTIDERLLVIWDGSSIHRSRAVKALLEEARGAIWLERLPGYAPDLNPDECVWWHLNNVHMTTQCSPTLEAHREELRTAIRRFKHRQDKLIPAFFKHPGL